MYKLRIADMSSYHGVDTGVDTNDLKLVPQLIYRLKSPGRVRGHHKVK